VLSVTAQAGWPVQRAALEAALRRLSAAKEGSDLLAEDGQEMDKSAVSPIRCPAKLLLELVELMGIEPMTS
jgi:hypothetical protein